MGKELKIEVNERVYNSVKEACQILEISPTTVYEYRRKNHCTTEEAVRAVNKLKFEPTEGWIAYGRIYTHIEEAARRYNVNGNVVRYNMNYKGDTLEEALVIAKDTKEFTEKCISSGINPYKARSFARHYGCTKEEAICCLNIAASASSESEMEDEDELY